MEFKIEKIPNRKISDIVADNIEQWIQQGKVQPGEKLPSVRELCEAFEVGRSAIRDAITTLKGKGLVDVKRGEGTFVCQLDLTNLFQKSLLIQQKDLEKLFHVRKMLEVGIAESAAKERKTEDLVKMENALQQLKGARTLSAWKSDYQFHLAIAQATQNEYLVQLMETISSTMKKAIMDCHSIILSDFQLTEQIREQHESLYFAIKQKDSEKARKAMLEHLTFVEKLLQKINV